MQCLVYIIIYITSDKLVTEQIMLHSCVHQQIGFVIQNCIRIRLLTYCTYLLCMVHTVSVQVIGICSPYIPLLQKLLKFRNSLRVQQTKFEQNSSPISSSHWLALFEEYEKAAEMSIKPQSELFMYLNQINFFLRSASRAPTIYIVQCTI